MWAIPLVILIWLLVAIKRGYLYLPAYELKRRGSRGNQTLYTMAATAPYQRSVRFFFNVLLYISTAGLALYLGRNVTVPTFIGVIIISTGGAWYASTKNSVTFVKLCAWLTKYLLPIFKQIDSIVVKIEKFRKKQLVTTDIYEREDLKKLIAKQKNAVNNRISAVDLEAVMHVLEFEHRKIATVMVPYKQIKFVNAKEPIGPILLSELHKSGYQYFPVIGNSKSDIQGILSLKKLAGFAEGGMVTEAMDNEVIYVRDNQPLEQVLQAFTKTGKQFFIVIDMREKVVGLITVRDVLEEIIGHSIHGEFENYHDPEAVAHG